MERSTDLLLCEPNNLIKSFKTLVQAGCRSKPTTRGVLLKLWMFDLILNKETSLSQALNLLYLKVPVMLFSILCHALSVCSPDQNSVGDHKKQQIQNQGQNTECPTLYMFSIDLWSKMTKHIYLNELAKTNWIQIKPLSPLIWEPAGCLESFNRWLWGLCIFVQNISFGHVLVLVVLLSVMLGSGI